MPDPPAKPKVVPPRFQLVAIKKRVNGIVSADIWDRNTNEVKEFFQYESVDNYILANIDPISGSVTLVGHDMTSMSLSVNPVKAGTGNEQ